MKKYTVLDNLYWSKEKLFPNDTDRLVTLGEVNVFRLLLSEFQELSVFGIQLSFSTSVVKSGIEKSLENVWMN